MLLLLCFWLYLAASAYGRGDTTRAFIFLGIGVALTVFRLGRART